MNERFSEARAIVDEAAARFNPSHIFGLFSGGHDSLCATHVASQHPLFSGAVHINTTIGIEETRDFVRATCQDRGWPLKEYRPPVSYRSIVLKHGFPGPGSHRFMYIRLKERCLDALIRDHKRRTRDRILLITGVRLQESSRRMGHVRPIVRVKTRVWTAPILNWSADDKLDYMKLHTLRSNSVVEQLCMSGECLCGAFAQPGEIHEIAALYPKTAALIRALEVAAEIAGVPAKWGVRPPRKLLEPAQYSLPLCWSCEAKREGGA